MGGDERDGGAAWIGVSAAARRWQVERQTAHKWFRSGQVANVEHDVRGLRAPERDVHAAKVLSPSHLEQRFQVAGDTLADAEREGRVRATDGRFSLDDLDILRGRVPRSAAPQRKARRRLTPQERTDLLRDLVARAVPLADYPDEVFETEVCPPFSPPVEGLFAYAIGEYIPPTRPMAVWIARSAGWARIDGVLQWVEAAARQRRLVPPVYELPRDMAHDTQLYRHYETAWRDEWLRRRRDDKPTTNI